MAHAERRIIFTPNALAGGAAAARPLRLKGDVTGHLSPVSPLRPGEGVSGTL